MPAAAQAPISLAVLNAMDRTAFAAAIGGVLEHSPHFAERAWTRRPFASIDAVHAALLAELDAAPEPERLALLNAHPDLANRLVALTSASTDEQRAAGLAALTSEEVSEFTRLNTAYRDRFGFPFIICARLNSKDTILAAFRARLDNSRETEFETALAEVAKIARLRLDDLLTA
jgi:2-oxo-4-hydroxy-4-carboxy-5-ureidoimidazoline decarboxylase